ncbi:unnamed protein product [Trifolium pratense]|uniref:Uncharacterized protein n=1 Tax=Trifolium pratense TaxID=57577 RepID=A0ACB0JB34_TRIPR|nr:unnamed protein product [Trifolium pratense]
MDNKKNPSSSAQDSNIQRPLGRGRIKKPAFKPPRTRILRPRRAKDKEIETIILSSDSSSSDDTDEDYAEFLCTWEPDDEEFPRSPSSEKEESQASELSSIDSKDEGTKEQDKP